MMWRKLLIISMVFASSMMLLTQSTFATCVQEDLEGTWGVRVGATDGFGNHLCWENCNLTISSGGVIEEGGTYLDCLGVSSEITGGGLTISSGCVIEGEIYTSNGTLYIDTGAIAGDELVPELVLGRAQD